MTRHHEELAEYNETMREVQELRAEIERLKAMTPDDDNDEPPELAEYNKAMQVVRELRAEIERLEADMAQIANIANIPPADDRYGSLAVRMEKIWLLSRGKS